MKIIILTVTAGYGHHAAAKALETALRARGAEVIVVDIIKYISTSLYKTVDKGYNLSTKHTPRGFGAMYHVMQKDNSFRRSASSLLRSGLLSSRITDLFYRERPDVVLASHVFGSLIIDHLLRKKLIRTRHIGVMTDYTIHPFWEDIENLEKLVVCSDLIIPRAIRRGIRADRLLPLGIPVDPAFLESKPREEACAALGLNPDMPVVLLMSGSMGFGNVAATVARIASTGRQMQLLCVCGKNQQLFQSLASQRYPVPVHLYGFVDNISTMMDAADIVITKPGGLSTTEALAKRKPLILTAPIPGQEEENIDYFLNAGLAMSATDNMPVHELVTLALDHPALLDRMRASIELFVKPHATESLCDYIYGVNGAIGIPNMSQYTVK